MLLPMDNSLGILHFFLKSFFIGSSVSLYMVIFIHIYLLGLIDYLAIMKVEEIEDVASELNNVVSNEQVLLQECADLLHQAHDMQVWFYQNKLLL